MRAAVKENLLVSPFLVFFLIHSSQIGVGIFSFQNTIVQSAGYDAWVGVIVAGLSIHIVIWFMFKILKNVDNDIIEVHRKLFGKWLGGGLSFSLILYIVFVSITIIRTYIEVIQIWVFPQLSTWVFGGMLVILIYNFVSGGFRTVTGICFLSVAYGLPLLVITFYFPLQYAQFSNLLPLITHSAKDLLLSSKQMAFSYIGFQLLFIFYPFIKNAKESQKWIHYANLFTTIIYLLVAIITFVYYSKSQLIHLPWASLVLWKTVELPVFSRFEIIGIAIWILVILPNICLGMWCSSRGAKRLFLVKQRHALFVILAVVFVVNGLLTKTADIKMLQTITGNVSLYLFYLYIPLLFVVQWGSDKIKGKEATKLSSED